MIRFDGNTDDDIKLWHTYVFWARHSAKSLTGIQPRVKQAAMVDDSKKGVRAVIMGIERQSSNAIRSSMREVPNRAPD